MCKRTPPKVYAFCMDRHTLWEVVCYHCCFIVLRTGQLGADHSKAGASWVAPPRSQSLARRYASTSSEWLRLCCTNTFERIRRSCSGSRTFSLLASLFLYRDSYGSGCAGTFDTGPFLSGPLPVCGAASSVRGEAVGDLWRMRESSRRGGTFMFWSGGRQGRVLWRAGPGGLMT